jgi:hypothetical protein
MDTTNSTNKKNIVQDIESLRVADQELSSGNTAGRVFVRLSTGSVAFLTERPVAQARVSRQLRAAIGAEPTSVSK